MANQRIKPGGKVFRDPIHQLIRIDQDDEFILDMIDTPEFQRLRRIRQLGVSWITYPGAEHSRFAHSLGVFNFVQRMLDVLRRRYARHEVAKYLEKNAKLVKAAALLHDIGHGPFSHMIERAFEDKPKKHELKTAELIGDKEGTIAGILSGAELNPEDVAALIGHLSPHQLLIDLVTSQLDADRMDYLLRDSHATGVQYGVYDAEWLLNAMCIGRNPGSQNNTDPHCVWRLALDERRGERAAEQFILARAHMNEQVYFHRVTRGFEALLLNVFRLAAKAAESGGLPAATPDVVVQYFKQKGALNREAWLHFDEPMVLASLHAWSTGGDSSDPALARLSRAFLNRDRVYSSASLHGIKTLDAPKLYDALQDTGLEKGVDWCTDDAESAVYKGILYSSQSRGADEEESLAESILLSSGKPDHKARAIETSSGLMAHLDKQRQSIVRLYFDRDRYEDIKPVLTRFKLRAESKGEPE